MARKGTKVLETKTADGFVRLSEPAYDGGPHVVIIKHASGTEAQHYKQMDTAKMAYEFYGGKV